MEKARIPLFKIGDKVKIANYGHAIWENKNQPFGEGHNFPTISEDENIRWIDIKPELVGKEGVVSKVGITQGIPEYSIEGIGSWYSEKQLELV